MRALRSRSSESVSRLLLALATMAMTRDHRLLATGLIPCIVVSAAGLVVVPWFNGIFVSAGVQLPWPTRLLLATYSWWGITIVGALALWRFWPSAERRGAVTATFGLWCFIALFVFGVIGCYAPIFALASFR